MKQGQSEDDLKVELWMCVKIHRYQFEVQNFVGIQRTGIKINCTAASLFYQICNSAINRLTYAEQEEDMMVSPTTPLSIRDPRPWHY
jgi:hypothetical protein